MWKMDYDLKREGWFNSIFVSWVLFNIILSQVQYIGVYIHFPMCIFVNYLMCNISYVISAILYFNILFIVKICVIWPYGHHAFLIKYTWTWTLWQYIPPANGLRFLSIFLHLLMIDFKSLGSLLKLGTFSTSFFSAKYCIFSSSLFNSVKQKQTKSLT